jgi:hypothetical protein
MATIVVAPAVALVGGGGEATGVGAAAHPGQMSSMLAKTSPRQVRLGCKISLAIFGFPARMLATRWITSENYFMPDALE